MHLRLRSPPLQSLQTHVQMKAAGTLDVRHTLVDAREERALAEMSNNFRSCFLDWHCGMLMAFVRSKRPALVACTACCLGPAHRGDRLSQMVPLARSK
jgi:hypothetical protein